MENGCGTSAAGLKLLSPACDAVIVQEPAPVRCTVEPVTVQLPLAPKVTARLEVALALTLKSGSPKVLSARVPKLIVWSAWVTVRAAVLLADENPISPAKDPLIPAG